MSKLIGLENVIRLMDKTENIRNMSVIAHVDHGKSTLTDTLVVKAGSLSAEKSGSRFTDTRADEQERGITIKSTAISMQFKLKEESYQHFMKEKTSENHFLINLIDSPGHVDFSSEVTAALRVTDGALVVVDCIEGICVQTETVLRQAVIEKIKPVLCLNKLDRSLLELQQAPTELASSLRKTIENFNATLSKFHVEEEGGKESGTVEALDPANLEVSFCSGLQGWGFTLRQFVEFYADTFKISEKTDPVEKLAVMKKFQALLWNHKCFYSKTDPFDGTGKFSKSGNPENLAFVVFVLNPLYRVRDLCMQGDKKGLVELMAKYKKELPKSVLEETNPKELFKGVMRRWLPAADTLLEQIIINLPSPSESQKYRAESLYEGPADDQFCTAIKNTDMSEDAPVMMYVSKMIPQGTGRYIAFGRVFSGVLKAGCQVYVQSPDYVPGVGKELKPKVVSRVFLMMGRTAPEIKQCPAGNIVGILGVDSEIQKTATICSMKGAHNIKSMKFSVSPVVRYSILPKNTADLPKLKEGLTKLSQVDSLCQVQYMKSGEIVVAGAGEMHVEICLNDLENEHAKVPIIRGEPQVSYFESISSSMSTTVMSKSANKHNKVYMIVEPLGEEITKAINEGDLISTDPKVRVELFKKRFDEVDEWIKRILCYAPDDCGPNVIVDSTKGVQNLNEVKEFLKMGLDCAVKEGPVIGEPVHGLRLDLMDLTLHADAIHRGAGQIIPTMSRLATGLVLAATPILYEPIFLAEISLQESMIDAAMQVVKSRRGEIVDAIYNGHRSCLKAYIPVQRSFKLNTELMETTAGGASVNLVLDHYAIVPGSLDKEDSPMFTIVRDLRKKKGMGELKDATEYFCRE
ncbi:elongation factor 2 [Nematocida homosporus]|uniref:elongation factor 2 n=1 Tax=Nematocida homosporus TaxID=1912981 RepID=UPI0022200415|nr:elongation factor 2 [Nematocida homosporus]KAI5186280.1 elongation factor 2 [Nematocida homosporus]